MAAKTSSMIHDVLHEVIFESSVGCWLIHCLYLASFNIDGTRIRQNKAIIEHSIANVKITETILPLYQLW